MSTAVVSTSGEAAGQGSRDRAGATPDTGGFQILLRMAVHPGMGEDFVRVWLENAASVEGHPANRGHSLARSVEGGYGAEGLDVFYIQTSWTDEASFRRFEQSPAHLEHRERLHPFRSAGSIVFLERVDDIDPVSDGTERPVQVVLHHRCDDPGAIAAAYHRTSRTMAGVPGLLGNELLCSMTDPAEYVVSSRWSGTSAFQQWEQGPEHKAQTAPLRPFRHASAGGAFACYRSVAGYTYPGSETDRTNRHRAGACRVVLRMTVAPGTGQDFESVWTRIAAGIAEEPANLAQTLLRDSGDPDRYVVVTDWVDEAAFRTFERGPAHVVNRRLLDRYRVEAVMAVTTVVVDH